MFSFLILSFLSGVIELGSAYIGIIHELPVCLILMLPLFYQTGNLMISVLPRRLLLNVIFTGIVCFLSIIYYICPNFWILAVELAFSSYCIQFMRACHKSSCPTWLKRSFRIAGFALSPIMLCNDGQIIFFFSALFCIFLIIKDTVAHRESKIISQGKKTQITGISMVMIFHQMHYFVYTYIMPIFIYTLTKSIIMSSLVFSVTWIVYLLPQTIAEKFNIVNYKKMFFFCHFFLGVCMAIIAVSAYFHNTTFVLLFWILTGLGGGSVFCIKHLCKRYESMNMDFSENIGHFVGPLIAVLFCCMTTEYVFIVLPAISCVFVIIALILSLHIVNKEYNYEK